MQLKPQLSEYEIEAIVRAVEEDINAGHISVTLAPTEMKNINRHSLGVRSQTNGSPALQKSVTQILEAAFKEGCKCGKGGYSQF